MGAEAVRRAAYGHGLDGSRARGARAGRKSGGV